MADYLPDEPMEIINLERNFLAGDLICGVGYGIQILLYGVCAKYLWGRRKQNPKLRYLLAYITLIFCIETIFVAVQARTVQVIYVDNRAYPGGPWQYFLDTQYLPINVMYYATLFLLTFLSDLLVLWRCWVIWTASGRKLAYAVTWFPALTLLGSFVMGTLWTLQSSQPGLSMYSALPMAYGTSYYSISLGANILLTLLIIARLLVYRKQMLGSLPPEHAKQYMSIATIVIESAALYSVCAIVFLITYAIGDPTNQVFFGVASAAQQIAMYMIIYRVADGRAWKTNTLEATLPTSAMQFKEKPAQESATLTHLSTLRSADADANDDRASSHSRGIKS